MLGATLLFSLMGLCVKLASAHFSAAEIVAGRGLIGVLLIAALARHQRVPLRTKLPGMHLWRGTIGVAALCLWFWAISGLPLATAMTLNQMSAIWMALFLLGGAVLMGASRLDPRLLATVLVGFVGVALVLQPTFERNQWPWALAGLASGVLAAVAYLQVTALGRAGEPELRVVFYFSLAGTGAGGALMGIVPSTTELRAWTLESFALLAAVGLTASVAQILMTSAYTHGKVLVNASLNYSGIVFSALLGWWMFGEQPGWIATLGIALIIGAGWTATALRTQQTSRTLPSDLHNE
ncbi:DMT family transporter [Inhella sp. 4Y17]|uniref:DMT family transporter n=2 Tax=Inhella gelatinilytica TaxID=2795030 RepID=A0A931ITZ0_9BURK|nr:DMT family transporter [Inhella gelatinilytica]